MTQVPQKTADMRMDILKGEKSLWKKMPQITLPFERNSPSLKNSRKKFVNVDQKEMQGLLSGK